MLRAAFPLLLILVEVGGPLLLRLLDVFVGHFLLVWIVEHLRRLDILVCMFLLVRLKAANERRYM